LVRLRETTGIGHALRMADHLTVESTTLLSGLANEPFGPATEGTWGNSAASSRSSDIDGNPSQFVSAGTTNFNSVDYSSRITGIADSELTTDS
jgi:hypothetical protein